MIIISLFMIALFNELQQGLFQLIAILILIISSELSLGSIFFVHITETCVESAVGAAS